MAATGDAAPGNGGRPGNDRAPDRCERTKDATNDRAAAQPRTDISGAAVLHLSCDHDRAGAEMGDQFREKICGRDA